MKFPNGISVLTYWYEYGDAVREYVIPAVFIHEDEVGKPPFLAPENFDYPDWWYTWVDIDKIISKKLGKKDWALILYYFRMVYKNEVGVFYRWNHNKAFRNLCGRIYSLLSDEYKPAPQRLYRKFPRVVRSLKRKVEGGIIDVTKIEPHKAYTVQEVMDILSYGRGTIEKLMRDGRLEVFRITPKSHPRITGQSILNLMFPGGEKDGEERNTS